MFPTMLAQAQMAPKVPADQPTRAITTDEVRRFNAAIAPYTAEARKTYPYAKARYLAGLPSGQTFFVTTRLTDPQGRFEGVFIRVTKIANGAITGRIASDQLKIVGYQAGAEYTFPEVELVDWTILKPDGSEEGNVVGKFLDTYRP
jgi:hypothetical protein